MIIIIKIMEAYGSIMCPSCAYPLEIDEVNRSLVEDWGKLPAGVKFDPSDQQILEHLEAKVKEDKQKLHPLIHHFILTLDGDDGICYTHPQYLPGIYISSHISSSSSFSLTL